MKLESNNGFPVYFRENDIGYFTENDIGYFTENPPPEPRDRRRQPVPDKPVQAAEYAHRSVAGCL